MEEKDLYGRIELHQKTLDERNEKEYTFLKYIITLCSGLVAVLVSLKKGVSPNHQTHLIFITTIFSLASTIFFGCILLYEEIFILSKSSKAVYDNIAESIKKGRVITFFENIETPIIFKIIRFLTFLGFISSIISLVIYASMIDK